MKNNIKSCTGNSSVPTRNDIENNPEHDRSGGAGNITRQTKKVFLIFDHPDWLVKIKGVLEQEADLEICGQIENYSHIPEDIRSADPDIVIVDLPVRADSFSILVSLRDEVPELPVLVITLSGYASFLISGLNVDAGYITTRNATEKTIVEVIRKAVGA